MELELLSLPLASAQAAAVVPPVYPGLEVAVAEAGGHDQRELLRSSAEGGLDAHL